MHRLCVRLGLAFVLVAGGAAPGLAEQKTHKVDRFLQRVVARGGSEETVPVIIRMRPGAEGSVQQQLKTRGHAIRKHHALIGAVTADVKVGDLAALAADASILSLSFDAVVETEAAPAKHQTANLARLLAANQLRATLGAAPDSVGAGIGVAIIDSGIAPLNDFDQIVEFRDFTRDGMLTRPFDDYGHGTHVAGLIASNGSLSGLKYVGIAPGVRLIGLKVLDAEGRGVASDVIAALEFATANRARLGIDVINLSLGHPIYQRAADDPLVQAVERAVRSGIVVLVSAGNFGRNSETKEIGYGGITSPGNAPSAITVGAEETDDTVTRLDDGVAKYSSRGPTWFDGLAKPDVVAPGDGLISDIPRMSTLYKRYNGLRYLTHKGYFLKLSGTSMATAVASGVAALALESNRNARLFESGVIKPTTVAASLEWSYANFAYLSSIRPALSPNAVKGILQYTAVPLSPSGATPDALTQGTGGINAEGAVRVASLVNASQATGTQWVAAPIVDRYTIIDGAALEWSQSVIWDNIRITGSLLEIHQPAWDPAIVWGTSEFCSGAPEDCDNIVWGTLSESEDDDNIVWGTFSEDQDNIVWGTSAAEDQDNIVWGTFAAEDQDNIVWGTNEVYDSPETWLFNIVWGTGLVAMSEDDDNIVWGTNEDLDNIVWGTFWMTLQGAVSVVGQAGGI